MADVQIENGYTKIANELFEAFARIRISGEARQVLDVILRKTYGYQKKEDRISLSQFCLATGINKVRVCHALIKLCDMNLIAKKDTPIGNIYRLNKDFETWKPLPKKITLPILAINIAKKDNASLPKKIHTKDNYTKEKRNTTLAQNAHVISFWAAMFEEFYSYYPRHEDKKAALKVWQKIKPSSELIDKMVEALRIQKKSEAWTKDKGKYIPYPATWLNGCRWEDEI